MKVKIDLRSLLVGALIGAGAVFAVGAGSTKQPLPDINRPRFAVVKIEKAYEPLGGAEVAVVRLGRFYGKISQQGLDFRLKEETQELKLVVPREAGLSIRTNDIIGLELCEHLQSGSYSRPVTHLPPEKSQSQETQDKSSLFSP